MGWNIIITGDSIAASLQNLPPLDNAAEQNQRARAVAFVHAELGDAKSVNLSGRASDGDHFVSLLIGSVGTEPAWKIKESTRAARFDRKTQRPTKTRETMIAALQDVSSSDQRGRAFAYAAGELMTSERLHAGINARGDASGLALSASTAD